EESDSLFKAWSIPSPVRGLYEVAFAKFTCHPASEVNVDNGSRGPLLLVSGTADHTVPVATTRASFRQYSESRAVTDYRQFEGRGHSLTIDSDWHDVASACLEWLRDKGLDSATPELANLADRETAEMAL